MKNEFQIVLHTDYGGFHVDSEMALWLMENKKWNVSKENGPSVHLLDSGFGDYLSEGKFFKDDVEMRRHPDFIACVKALQKLHENDDRYGPDGRPRDFYVNNLSVVNVTLELSIEDYHDGKEKISVQTYTEIDDSHLED